MVTTFLVFLLATISWVAALWLLIQPDFSRWPQPGIVALHAAPPLLAWMIWMWFHRRLQARKEADARAREEQEQSERKAALEEARKKHAEEMRQRRFACDCRAIAISGLTAHADMRHVDIAHRSADDDNVPAGPVLDALTPTIADS